MKINRVKWNRSKPSGTLPFSPTFVMVGGGTLWSDPLTKNQKVHNQGLSGAANMLHSDWEWQGISGNGITYN